MTPWEIQATEIINCNCAYGCPCQFNALPTYGTCESVRTMQIHEGHHGDVTLDGLRMGCIFQWPGAVHDGNGRCQPFVDERATDRQREALLKIMSGEDTDPMATVFAVYATTVVEVYEPIFAPIAFEADVEARKGRVHVPGLMESRGEPILNPKTGEEHRARIELPDGFEFAVAEISSGTTKTEGKISLNFENTHGHFADLHLNNHGVVRQSAA